MHFEVRCGMMNGLGGTLEDICTALGVLDLVLAHVVVWLEFIIWVDQRGDLDVILCKVFVFCIVGAWFVFLGLATLGKAFVAVGRVLVTGAQEVLAMVRIVAVVVMATVVCKVIIAESSTVAGFMFDVWCRWSDAEERCGGHLLAEEARSPDLSWEFLNALWRVRGDVLTNGGI